ncbi:MAG: DoxX family protein [Candidatus Thermoplasmatota archaeon]
MVSVLDVAFLAGRIILGLFFLSNAYGHLGKLKMMSGYAASKGVPMPTVAVAGTGLLLVIGGAGILLGTYPRVALLALVLFFLGVAPMMHNFWTLTDPMAKQMDMVMFLKDVALMGACLALLAMPEPWPLSLGPESGFP